MNKHKGIAFAVDIILITTFQTPSKKLRGSQLTLKGGTGVADTIHICLKNAADAYVWVQIN